RKAEAGGGVTAGLEVATADALGSQAGLVAPADVVAPAAVRRTPDRGTVRCAVEPRAAGLPQLAAGPLTARAPAGTTEAAAALLAVGTAVAIGTGKEVLLALGLLGIAPGALQPQRGQHRGSQAYAEPPHRLPARHLLCQRARQVIEAFAPITRRQPG